VEQKYLSPAEAEAVLRERGVPRTQATLAKYRCVGGGPQFVSFGRQPRYTEAWLLAWVQTVLSAPKRSTSDTGAGKAA
jgi:hypothetical protein